MNLPTEAYLSHLEQHSSDLSHMYNDALRNGSWEMVLKISEYSEFVNDYLEDKGRGTCRIRDKRFRDKIEMLVSGKKTEKEVFEMMKNES